MINTLKDTTKASTLDLLRLTTVRVTKPLNGMMSAAVLLILQHPSGVNVWIGKLTRLANGGYCTVSIHVYKI